MKFQICEEPLFGNDEPNSLFISDLKRIKLDQHPKPTSLAWTEAAKEPASSFPPDAILAQDFLAAYPF